MPDPDPTQRGVLAWFASNHVAANLLMISVLAAGGIALATMKVEVFQEIDPGLIRVDVPYPGATPSEVEESICMRVEEAIKGIEGIKHIRSVAAEGLGSVIAELEDYADDREVLDDVKTAVDRILDFPPRDAEEPVVVDVEARIQVVSLVVHGDVPRRTLKELAEQVRYDLTTNPGITIVSKLDWFLSLGGWLYNPYRSPDISLVDLVGAQRYEISIEVSEQTLQRYGLTLEQVARVVRRSSLDLTAGSVKTEGGEFLIRTKGQRYVGADFENIVVRTGNDGTKLTLKDMATIVDGFEDSDLATYFDGSPAVLLKVYRVGDQGALDVAQAVKRYIETRPLPAGVSMASWFDRSGYLQGRINLLVRNASIGLSLVFLCLLCFLNVRLAFWTTMGIPISFMGGFLLMWVFGVSVNMISLFALIVVLGIVVDDAIVVGENIYAYKQRGMGGLEAAVRGVQEIAMPVVLTVLTTVAAFAPLVYTAGQLGKILWPIPAVVTSVLAVSLVEALLILPAHLRHVPARTSGPLGRAQDTVQRGMLWFIDVPYTRLLGAATRWRYLTIAIAVAIILITVGTIAGGHLRFRFMPDVDADNVWVSLKMPQGTTAAQTQGIVRRLESSIVQVGRELDAKTPDKAGSIVEHMVTTVGDQPFTTLAGGGPGALASTGAGGGHLGEVNVQLRSGEERSIPSRDIAAQWRQAAGDVPGVSNLTFTSQFFSAGDAIDVQLKHANFERLLAAVDELKRRLQQFAGVRQINDDFDPGKPELKLRLQTAGRAAGLTLEDLARQVRQAFYGEEVQRIQRGRDEIKIMVRFPEAQRRSLDDVASMRIRLPDATEVPFATVADVVQGRGFAAIDRVDRRRAVSVTADVDAATANANQINAELREQVLPELKRSFPGLIYDFEGEQREQRESLESMGRNQLVALLFIFGLLALQFRSYIQPLIVMSVIPFGLVGAAIGHMIMGLDLSMLSGFGIVALTGVVVNDSLIMIDLTNRRRRDGVPLREAVLESGVRRFRPIILTSATTFFGLMPMILERSLQAQFLIPMAVSLGFGVIFATGITLLLVPCVYLILEDLKTVFDTVFGGRVRTTSLPA